MTRVPTAADFAGLAPDLAVALHFPDPPASTTALMLLFHGLGDAETPFAAFARAVNVPGVLAIAVRGPAVVPAALAADDDDDYMSGDGPQHFHWGDDLRLDGGGELDADPGFDRAVRLVDERLLRGVLIERCGWRYDDVLLFGFGQGGTFALALAVRLAISSRLSSSSSPPSSPLPSSSFKGIVAIAPAVPSAVATGLPAGTRLATPLLVCGPAGGDAVSAETLALLRQRFVSVEKAAWARAREDDNGMPRCRAEMLPIMQFLAAHLRHGP